jgi:hypothetical protein
MVSTALRTLPAPLPRSLGWPLLDYFGITPLPVAPIRPQTRKPEGAPALSRSKPKPQVSKEIDFPSALLEPDAAGTAAITLGYFLVILGVSRKATAKNRRPNVKNRIKV